MAKKITDLELKAHDKRGRLLVAEGLYLQVSKWGTKSWEYRYTLDERTRSMGLGGYPKVSLKAAREQVTQLAAKVANGVDPVAERQAKRRSAARDKLTLTFAQAAAAYIKANVDVAEGGFKNVKHRAQWTSTIESYANPIIGKLNVADVDTHQVLLVLQQDVRDREGQVVGTLWGTKNETASRLRGRIESVLSWAAFRGLRPQGDNPARWKGHLDTELVAPAKVRKVTHHAALPYAEIGAFMADLRAVPTVSARCLEFSILAACRSSEARLATWDMVDLTGKRIVCPAELMKASKEHEVPLPNEAVALLEALPREEGNPLVFIGTARNGGLSENALNNTAKAVSGKDITQHGFRSTFREWAGEMTAHPREVIEHALAHSLKDKAEAAYQRGSLMPKRRRLMQDWATYCGTVQPQVAPVVPIRGAV